MKKLLLPCALALGLSLAASGTASAAPCSPTTLFRDGHFLNAQHVALTGETISGTVDASGCEIGVYIGPGVSATVDGANVQNAQYFGVVTDGSAANGVIRNSSVHDTGDAPAFSGAQHGIDVAFLDGSSGSVGDSQIYRYQKGGVVVSGDGTNADTIGNNVDGSAAPAIIAPNGVQYSFGARGEASYNTISHNNYVACPDQQTAKRTGCTPYVSAGLLLYDVNPSDVNRNRNLYRDDQRNELVTPSKELDAHSNP